MPSALRRPLALSVCTAANDRGTLVWENPGEQRQIAGAVNASRGTSRGWQPGPWSGYKDCTLALTKRLRLRGKGRKCFPGCAAAARQTPRPTRLSASWASMPTPRRVEGNTSSATTRSRCGGTEVALAVAHKTGERIGLDTSTRLAMNAVFAPDREHPGDRKPQPFSQAHELKGSLALKPFRLQFISSASDRGPSIVTEVEI